jgi:nickel transport protein
MAHRVNLFAWVEGDTVFTESFFSDGAKSIGSRIDVFDPEGEILLTGRTDDEGRFSFKIPKKTDLTIVLNASMGHRVEYILSASEIVKMPSYFLPGPKGGKQSAEIKEGGEEVSDER